MNTFYIIRHGETENNRHGRLSGWIDTPLTDTGLEPTKRVITQLKNVPITHIYSSDLGRAFVTAYVLARGIGYQTEIIRLPGLREVNYGDAANMLRAEAYARYPQIDNDTHYTPPNGESLADMQLRVLTTMHDLDTKHTDAVIAIVAHSGVLAALNAQYLGNDFGHHNISEAYAHDYVGIMTIADDSVVSFEKFSAQAIESRS